MGNWDKFAGLKESVKRLVSDPTVNDQSSVTVLYNHTELFLHSISTGRNGSIHIELDSEAVTTDTTATERTQEQLQKQELFNGLIGLVDRLKNELNDATDFMSTMQKYEDDKARERRESKVKLIDEVETFLIDHTR